MKKLVYWSLIIFSLFFTLSFMVISLYRIGVKFNMGPFEDMSLHVSLQILQGKLPYLDATVYYIPAIYAPFYFYLSAFFIKIFGVSLFSIRLPSLISVLLYIPIIYLLGKKLLIKSSRKENILFTTISFGLFLSSYYLTDLWIDLAKVDALFIFLLLLTLFSQFKSTENQKIYPVIFLAIVSVAIALTKQTGILLFPLTIVIYILLREYKKAFYFLFVYLLFFSGLVFFFELNPDSRFLEYNFIIPMNHTLSSKGVALEFFKTIAPLAIIGIIGLFIILYFIYSEYMFNPIKFISSSAGRVYIILSGYLVLSFILSFTGRMKMGAVSNSWLYFYSIASLFAVYFLFEIQKRIVFGDKFKNINDKDYNPGKYRAILYLYYIVSILILLQFITGLYNPIKLLKKYSYYHKIQNEYLKSLCNIAPEFINQDAPALQSVYCNKKASFTYAMAIDIVLDQKQFQHFQTSFMHSIELKEFPIIISTLDYQPSKLKEFIHSLKHIIENEKNKRKKNELIGTLRGIELEFLYRSKYKLIPFADMTIDQKNFVLLEENILRLEESLKYKKVFLLKLK